MSLPENKPKNYLKTTIYILTTQQQAYTTTVDNAVVRKPFATLALAKEQYAVACANNAHNMLQKLTVQGTPRGIGMAMYVLGQKSGRLEHNCPHSDDVFGEYVEYIAFETVTEQAGAL